MKTLSERIEILEKEAAERRAIIEQMTAAKEASTKPGNLTSDWILNQDLWFALHFVNNHPTAENELCNGEYSRVRIVGEEICFREASTDWGTYNALVAWSREYGGEVAYWARVKPLVVLPCMQIVYNVCEMLKGVIGKEKS